MARPETRKVITALGSGAKPNPLTAFAAYVAVQNKKRVEVDKAAGVKEY